MAIALTGALMVPSTAAEVGSGEDLRSPIEFQGTERAVPPQVGRVGSAVGDGNRILILDSRHHRILEARGEELKLAGGIGNGPNELFYPTEMVLDGESGRVAINDGGNDRIQVFDRTLRPIVQISVKEKILGLSWWRGDRLLVGAPDAGRLLAIYEATGRRVGSLGELADPPQLLGLEQGVQELYRRALSRVRLATRPDGDVWVAFIHLPMVRRYSPRGLLTLERSLELRGLGELPSYARSVFDPSDQPSSASFINIDGLQLALVVKDIALHPQTGHPILLLGNDWLARLDGEGRIELVGEVAGCRGSFHRLGIDASRQILMITSLATQLICDVDLDEVTPEAFQPLLQQPQRIHQTPESG